jgi:hypothetical protein
MSPSRRIDALTDSLLHYGRQSKSKLGERWMVRAMELQKTAIEMFNEMVDSITNILAGSVSPRLDAPRVAGSFPNSPSEGFYHMPFR